MVGRPQMRSGDAPESIPLVASHTETVSPLISAPKRVRKPAAKTKKKPPAPRGYFWRSHSAGWDLKKRVVVASHNGEEKRREIYVAHLGAAEFGELKKRHKGAALERAIAEWIAEHDR